MSTRTVTPSQAGPTGRPAYLTVAEVADQLRVDVFTVRRYIGRGQLEAYLVGRTYRVEQAAVDAFMAARRV